MMSNCCSASVDNPSGEGTEGRCNDCKEMCEIVEDTYFELKLYSNGKIVKTYVIPGNYLDIEDIKKRGITTLSGESVLDNVTDYYRFIITANEGYTETLGDKL